MTASPQRSGVRAPRNRTLEVSDVDAERLLAAVIQGDNISDHSDLQDVVICGDALSVLRQLPLGRFDLLFADPPYNLTKNFGADTFRERPSAEYEAFLDSWLALCQPLLKPNASVYICGDWRSSAVIQTVGSRYFKLRNRITWEREKG